MLKNKPSGPSKSPARTGQEDMMNGQKKPNGIPVITHDVYEYLMDMTKPSLLDHNSSHGSMIRNVVLEDIRRRIHAAYTKS